MFRFLLMVTPNKKMDQMKQKEKIQLKVRRLKTLRKALYLFLKQEIVFQDVSEMSKIKLSNLPYTSEELFNCISGDRSVKEVDFWSMSLFLKKQGYSLSVDEWGHLLFRIKLRRVFWFEDLREMTINRTEFYEFITPAEKIYEDLEYRRGSCSITEAIRRDDSPNKLKKFCEKEELAEKGEKGKDGIFVSNYLEGSTRDAGTPRGSFKTPEKMGYRRRGRKLQISTHFEAYTPRRRPIADNWSEESPVLRKSLF